jgi:hypothetical protein
MFDTPLSQKVALPAPAPPPLTARYQESSVLVVMYCSPLLLVRTQASRVRAELTL